MQAVEELVSRVMATGDDDAIDELCNATDSWLRTGAADAVAEAFGLLVDRGASIQLLVCALCFSSGVRWAWTDGVRAERQRIIESIREREPERWRELVDGLENESSDPGDLLGALHAQGLIQ